jgi:ABC-type Fe3+-hydroxamate transport system substrate-binding protein
MPNLRLNKHQAESLLAAIRFVSEIYNQDEYADGLNDDMLEALDAIATKLKHVTDCRCAVCQK